MLLFNKIYILILALLLNIFYLFSSEPESMLLFSVDSFNKARIGVINPSSKKITLSLTNEDGTPVHTTDVDKETNYFKIYDFSKLLDGEYKLSLLGSYNTEERQFEKKEDKIYIVKKYNQNNEPVFNLIENSYLVISYLKPDKDETVKVRFEKDGKLIFEDVDTSPVNFNKKYSINKLPKGKYVAKVVSGYKTFNYNFIIN